MSDMDRKVHADVLAVQRTIRQWEDSHLVLTLAESRLVDTVLRQLLSQAIDRREDHQRRAHRAAQQPAASR